MPLRAAIEVPQSAGALLACPLHPQTACHLLGRKLRPQDAAVSALLAHLHGDLLCQVGSPLLHITDSANP